jgi:CHASE1-domain containing sensor protein
MSRGKRTQLTAPDRSLLRDRIVALLLVSCVLIATAASWAVFRGRENDDASHEREDEAAALVGQLSAGYAQTEAVLATANALVDTTGTVDLQRFETFAQVVLAPGLAGALAYEPIVLDEQRAQFETQSGVRIVDRAADGTFVTAPRRAFYFPVAAVAPNGDIPRRTLGFDIAQDPSRGDIARLARAQGAARITAFVPLAPLNRIGFLIVQPLKRPDGEVAGFITVTYQGDAVGQSIVAGLPSGARLRIADEGTELFRTPASPHDNRAQNLDIGGRTWQIDVDIPEAPSRTLSTAILAGGLGLTALAALAALLSLRHQRALILSRQQVARERDLAAVLALAVTTAEVLATAAEAIPLIAPAWAVSIGLLEGAEVHIQHSPSLDSSLIERWSVIPVASSTPFTDAVRTGKRLVFGHADEIEAHYPRVQLDSLRVARALVCNPLAVRQKVIGALAFGFAEVQTFDDEQLRWLDQITAMVAGALERARLYDMQAQVALTLQRDLLPEALPKSSNFTLSAAYRPGVALSLVGGDWYDAFELADGRLAITIGDVAGKGVRAAASMGKMRHVLRACAGAYREPGLVLGYANRLIYEGSREVFATACYMTLDASGQCRFALAGHPPPLVIGSQGADLVHNKAGAPLGVNGTSHYSEASFQLEDSDAVVLYTDGLVERRHEDIDTSLARLVDVARGLTGQIDAHTFTEALGDNARDDVVVLFVQRTASVHEAPMPVVADFGDGHTYGHAAPSTAAGVPETRS